MICKNKDFDPLKIVIAIARQTGSGKYDRGRKRHHHR